MKNKKEPQFINSPLNNPMRNYSVYTMSLFESVAVKVICFIVGGFVGLVFFSGLFKSDGYATMATYISDAIVFSVFGFFAMRFLQKMYLERAVNKQKNNIKNQFRDMLESLSASLSTGSNVNQAFESALNDLKMQYNESDFIVIEMQEILDGVAQNISIDKMIRSFGDRSGNEDIESFADVFEVCHRKGGDMCSVIRRTNTVISNKMATADEIETKLTSNKLQLNIMSLAPIAVIAMLRLTSPSLAENFATPIGVIVNLIAVLIFVVAYKYGKKIVDIKG